MFFLVSFFAAFLVSFTITSSSSSSSSSSKSEDARLFSSSSTIVGDMSKFSRSPILKTNGSCIRAWTFFRINQLLAAKSGSRLENSASTSSFPSTCVKASSKVNSRNSPIILFRLSCIVGVSHFSFSWFITISIHSWHSTCNIHTK